MKILREKINVVSLENPAPNKKKTSLGEGKKNKKSSMKSAVFLLKRYLQFNMLYLFNITNAGMTENIYCYCLGN